MYFLAPDHVFDCLHLSHVLSSSRKGYWERKYLTVSASMVGRGLVMPFTKTGKMGKGVPNIGKMEFQYLGKGFAF